MHGIDTSRTKHWTKTHLSILDSSGMIKFQSLPAGSLPVDAPQPIETTQATLHPRSLNPGLRKHWNAWKMVSGLSIWRTEHEIRLTYRGVFEFAVCSRTFQVNTQTLNWKLTSNQPQRTNIHSQLYAPHFFKHQHLTWQNMPFFSDGKNHNHTAPFTCWIRINICNDESALVDWCTAGAEKQSH